MLGAPSFTATLLECSRESGKRLYLPTTTSRAHRPFGDRERPPYSLYKIMVKCWLIILLNLDFTFCQGACAGAQYLTMVNKALHRPRREEGTITDMVKLKAPSSTL